MQQSRGRACVVARRFPGFRWTTQHRRGRLAAQEGQGHSEAARPRSRAPPPPRASLAMRAYINEFLIGTGVAAILAVLSVSWMVRDVEAQLSDVTRDEVLSVERCLSNNPEASIDPLEEKELIKAGIIEEDLDKVKI